MIKRGCGLRLLDKAPHTILIRSEVWRKELQSYFAIKFRVVRQIDFTHSARAEFRDNAVMRQNGVGFEFVSHPVVHLPSLHAKGSTSTIDSNPSIVASLPLALFLRK